MRVLRVLAAALCALGLSLQVGARFSSLGICAWLPVVSLTGGAVAGGGGSGWRRQGARGGGQRVCGRGHEDGHLSALEAH
jgi:hypothetical protein